MIDFINDSTIINYDLKQLIKEIIEILQFEKQLLEPVSSNITRLNRFRVLVERRIERGAIGGEPIYEVICSECCRSTLFRLDLRDNAVISDTIYRIPGLSFTETLERGVGLVIRGGRIMGRMLYAPPICIC